MDAIMRSLKIYVIKNFEALFVLAVLTSIILLNYFVYARIPFLNFYYLPVLFAGYFFGKRTAVLGASSIIIMVSVFFIFSITEDGRSVYEGARFDLYFTLAVWGSFLILAGAAVGELSQRIKKELAISKQLHKDLALEHQLLEESNRQLNQYSSQLEERVEKRTQELERSNKDLEDFASIASHDLKEPLRKISSFGELLKDGLPDLKPPASEYLDRIQRSAVRMENFINDLLDFSSITFKAKPFELTDLNQIVEEVLIDLETRIANTGGTVRIINLPTLEADPFQMRQLFQNLIGNALKFHREDSPPVISLDCKKDEGSKWVISVKDNGVGFDPEHAERIFKPFERLHGKSAYEGTGIGLAICMKIVNRHNGEISVTSDTQSGSEFTVTLPEKQPGPENRLE